MLRSANTESGGGRLISKPQQMDGGLGLHPRPVALIDTRWLSSASGRVWRAPGPRGTVLDVALTARVRVMYMHCEVLRPAWAASRSELDISQHMMQPVHKIYDTNVNVTANYTSLHLL